MIWFYISSITNNIEHFCLLILGIRIIFCVCSTHLLISLKMGYLFLVNCFYIFFKHYITYFVISMFYIHYLNLYIVFYSVFFLFFFKNFYCYSITVVCLFSPSLHPTLCFLINRNSLLYHYQLTLYFMVSTFGSC